MTGPRYSLFAIRKYKILQEAIGGVNLNLLTHEKQKVMQKAAWAQLFYIFSNQTTYKKKESVLAESSRLTLPTALFVFTTN